MEYRKNPKNGDKLSVLGYGCMRYTKKGGSIDQEKAEKEMLYALEHGVNYFDTAYVYRGCEVALGKFLAKGHRQNVYIATKLPHYQLKTLDDAQRIFQEELSRLQTDYIDYYLIHMLTDVAAWRRLEKMGLGDWLEQKVKNGEIRNVGFSYHGGTKGFIDLIDAHPWDFVQIQFNYMDEHSQAGLKGLEYAAAQDIPVIIMEPLRGGRLTVDLPPKAKDIFAQAQPYRTAAEWGLRWIWNHPEVTVVLSGMNDISQVTENVAVADVALANSLSDEELAIFPRVKEAIDKSVKIPCTGCGYCMPCPKAVDIPNAFRSYNVSYSDGWYHGIREYYMATTMRTNPTNAGLCVQCGKCKKHCPQSINVPEEILKVQKRMENPLYKLVAKFSKYFVKF
ncbi:MAG: aldo/keto reductase [Clostridiales bacterium]